MKKILTAQKIVDSMPTVEEIQERKEEKWIPVNIPYDNVQAHKVAAQRELICNLNAMNDELQAKLDKIKQIVNENEICN